MSVRYRIQWFSLDGFDRKAFRYSQEDARAFAAKLVSAGINPLNITIEQWI